MAAWRRRLEANEIPIREEDHGTQQSIYFDDPNGIVLEVTTPPSAGAIQPNPAAGEVIERFMKRR
jgi:catechol-2,3-dioxygenase